MRIGIYDPYFDDLGGGEKYMMTVAEVLSHGHEVVIFWDNEGDFEQFKKRFNLDLEKVSLHKNIFSSTFSLWQRMKLSSSFDILIVLSDGSIPVVLSKKLFLHIQQPITEIKNLSWKEKLKLIRVDGIFYNSKFTKSYNNSLFFGVKNTIIYPPVNLQPQKMKKENIILHVGRFRIKDDITGINDFKKQKVMIEVFKKMCDDKKIKNWQFFLAVSVKKDDQGTFEKVQQTTEGYPITFFVNKTNDDLWELYNKAKIYWHASGFGEDLINHPEYAEHFGMSTVEAMGAGVVPVVINAGGQKEIVTDEKNGFLWDTLEELQERTEKLMNNEDLRTRLAKDAQKRAKDFSRERFYEQISRLITE